ncbi:NAD-binding protein [Chitinibacter bivalviorum]|uniref:NAD-binding protein n=1 Tax=Chitinibacter bivalviorum TaxID=2739434 RepID=A0A7H9BFI2_9NEIS|nr:NAD-binding protein [Chitinibacter bivalviorum]QLG87337.1 NAD-binding protein [Chitinibacter bivalviorum]
MDGIFFLMLRRLRAPIVMLISVYAIAVLGLVLIPGIDGDGKPYHIDFFHAFYFISYTATSIGFGEIPHPFTYQQRLWVLVCIYLAVTGWAYTIGSIFGLMRDESLRKAIAHARFRRKVRRISEPFYLICGYGQSARLLCKVLDDLDMRFVIVELREERINDIALADFHYDTPCIAGDAANPELLKVAGIEHPQCIGIIGITGNEEVNLAIAISAYVLRPKLLSICRSRNRSVAENMASFGTNKVINLFETVGRKFARRLQQPTVAQLCDVLADFPGNLISNDPPPPIGHWVIVGYGRFGGAVYTALIQAGCTVTVIDPEPQAQLPESDFILALGVDAASLRQARIEQAVGLLVSHDHDANNLSALATAREINPHLYTVARQNLTHNHILFQAFKPNITSIRAQIIAHECLRAMENPLLADAMSLIQQQSEDWAAQLLPQLNQLCAGHVPEIWRVQFNAKNASAVHAMLAQPQPPLRIDHYTHDALNHGNTLQCLALLHRHAGCDTLLPSGETLLQFGDELLFAGDHHARIAHNAVQESIALLDYIRTGVEQPQSWIFRKLAQRKTDQLAAH